MIILSSSQMPTIFEKLEFLFEMVCRTFQKCLIFFTIKTSNELAVVTSWQDTKVFDLKPLGIHLSGEILREH